VASRDELCWAAGFWDGEGCASITRVRGRYVYLQLSIKQVNRENLERFRRAVGGGKINGPYPHGNGKPISQWQTTGRESERIAALLLPFIGSEKRQQINRMHRMLVADAQMELGVA